MSPQAPIAGQAPRIAAVASALPPHHVGQEELISALQKLWGKKHYNVDRLADLHRSVQVSGRYLSLPIDEYGSLDTFAKRNQAWIRVAQDLGEQAISRALAASGHAADQIDHLFFVTVTGIATPSIDARLVNRLKLRPDVKRTPIFGLGCVAGAAGLARAADYLAGAKDQVAVLLSVELCSLTLQREDVSIPNLIASGLFGDGAAAVVLTGPDRRAQGPGIVATRSVFYPETESMMGWDVVDTGFKIVLSAQVPNLVKQRLAADVDAFLSSYGLSRSDVRHWIAHTGGPKVLTAFETALALPPRALQRSWDSLSQTGNLSSASVLMVLERLLADGEAVSGDHGLLLAMGPGFCSELVLLQW